ncbi:MAG: Asp-tRNA(Asn)/Glu-tRNA(Gln) amidotransferase subunit GatC [Ruminococcus sp.]|nr:Asp-tRNA(Asn)/Glu-tRNA(Gln) amidotransferase subunit GatC [Ruminococcus sp.]
MKIDIAHLAGLAHLHIDKEQLPQFEKDMQAIADMMGQLPELDDILEPDAENAMPLRADVPEENKFTRDELLANAPCTESGCFAVPKIVEQEA